MLFVAVNWVIQIENFNFEAFMINRITETTKMFMRLPYITYGTHISPQITSQNRPIVSKNDK